MRERGDRVFSALTASCSSRPPCALPNDSNETLCVRSGLSPRILLDKAGLAAVHILPPGRPSVRGEDWKEDQEGHFSSKTGPVHWYYSHGLAAGKCFGCSKFLQRDKFGNATHRPGTIRPEAEPGARHKPRVGRIRRFPKPRVPPL